MCVFKVRWVPVSEEIATTTAVLYTTQLAPILKIHFYFGEEAPALRAGSLEMVRKHFWGVESFMGQKADWN